MDANPTSLCEDRHPWHLRQGYLSLFALLFITKSKSQSPEMLGDNSTWWTSTTSPSLALLGLTVSDSCHRNPWLEPNEWKISHWLVSLTKCLAILDFFVQRDSNQRENNIWSLTISNHPNKTVPFTQSFHSPRLGDLKPSNVVWARLLKWL